MKAPGFWHEIGPLGVLMAPLGWLYATGGAARAAFARPWKAPVPVVCVGNLIAGGAGKTPVALAVGERLRAGGVSFAFLSRGYGGVEPGPIEVDPARHGARAVGDEPLLLAALAPTVVAHDRVVGAQAAIALGARVIVMDDGFQNPSLVKDLSLVVVDGGYGFGNGLVIPAGPLRETVGAGLARAQAAVVVGEDRAGVGAMLGRRGRGRVPVLNARMVPDPVTAELLRGRAVMAFAGIGRPDKFFETVRGTGCEVIEARAFPDHHPYAEGELADLIERAARTGAVPVTTAKDAVRLPPRFAEAVTVLTARLSWDDEGALDALLEPVIRHGQ